MDVRLSTHAEQQIVERNLDREQVIAIAKNPEQVIHGEDQLPVAQSRVVIEGKQYLIRVVYRDENELRLVVTAYRTSQVRKYWREESQDENTI
jgi:hypothetical protein